MSVLVEEWPGSPVKSRNLQGVTFTHTYLIAWDAVDAFMLERINQPYQEVDPNSIWAAFGLSVSLHPWGKHFNVPGDLTKNKWSNAKATVVYGTPSVNVLNYPKEDGVITERIAGNAELITLPAGNFQWGPGEGQDPLDEDQAPTKLITGLDYIYTVHNIQFAPLAVLDALSSVNDAVIQPMLGSPYQNLLFQPETLLFIKPTMFASINSGGQSRITAEYQFSYRPGWDKPGTSERQALGWNAFWRPSGVGGEGGFEHIYATGQTDSDKYYRNFPAVNFEGIFVS